VQVGDDIAILAYIIVEAIAVEALPLADKGCQWLTGAPLALLFLARSATA
jgi:hypothetical protein